MQRVYTKYLAVISGLGSLLILGLVLKYCQYGLDFTDEGFYLSWISNPFIYNISLSQFGFIYHPLYLLLNENIILLRQSNVLITFVLSFFLMNTCLKIYCINFCIEKWERLMLSVGLAAAGLLYFQTPLYTPSYNSLCLQGLLIVANGLLLIESSLTKDSLKGWILVSLGSWLVFMAKISTAFILVICLFCFLLIKLKSKIYFSLIPIFLSFFILLLSVFYIDGSLNLFVDRVSTGLEFSNYLGTHKIITILRIDDFLISKKLKIFFVFLLGLICLSFFSIYSRKNNINFINIIFQSIIFLFLLLVVLNIFHNFQEIGKFQGLLIWVVPITLVLLTAKTSSKSSIHQVIFNGIFIIFPYFYVFGTISNYWVCSSFAGIFWVLFGLLFFIPTVSDVRQYTLIFTFISISQVIVIFLFMTGVNSPYRQPRPLYENKSLVPYGRKDSKLIMLEEFSMYLNTIYQETKNANFMAGTPMIDLTGQSPGIVYALNAVSIGQPWFIGGYSGSDYLAVEALKEVSCEVLSKAWILFEKDGPRNLSPSVLASFGAKLFNDYAVVATWRAAEGVGGYKQERVQQLLKPIRSLSKAIHACEIIRKQ